MFQVESFCVIRLYETVGEKETRINFKETTRQFYILALKFNKFPPVNCSKYICFGRKDIFMCVLGNLALSFYAWTLWVIFGEILDSVYKETRGGDEVPGSLCPTHRFILSFMETLQLRVQT